MNTSWKLIFSRKALKCFFNGRCLRKEYGDHLFYCEEIWMPTVVPFLFYYES